MSHRLLELSYRLLELSCRLLALSSRLLELSCQLAAEGYDVSRALHLLKNEVMKHQECKLFSWMVLGSRIRSAHVSSLLMFV